MITLQKRKFAPEFKRRAAERLINSDESGSEIAEELGVTAGLLYKCKRKLQADPQPCFPTKDIDSQEHPLRRNCGV